MNKKVVFFLVLFLWTCSSGSKKSPTEPEEVFVVDLSQLTGQVQKGPFNNGTSIVVSELSNNLSPTGRNFNSSINDNTGRFTVANVQLVSPYVELRANGFYFNEVSNGISDSQLTLSAISDLTSKTSLNVNVLTHLEKNRIQFLITGENPLSFSAAKLQAQEEVLGIFDFSRANMPESEVLDISQGGVSNAKLLAISAILQGNLTVGQMSELLANISTDITSDGALDDQNLKNTLIDNSKNLDLSSIRTNLEARFTSLGIEATVADFESEVNNFLKPPSAEDISTSTEEDTPINITLDGSDPEDETLSYALVEVNNASVSLDGNVALYTPDLNWNGTDTFTYKVNDGTSDSNIATVTVVVGEVDDEPNTLDISTSTDEDIAVAMNLTAEEYDGDSYSFDIVSQPSNGSVSLSSATATYTPAQDFNGTDTFTFQASDNAGRRLNVATATITVNAVNDAPVANDITNQVTDENKMMQLDITLDASDVDGDALTYSVTSTGIGTVDGSVTINDNIATYVPTKDWNGEDTFTYVANDGTVDSNAATVTITVNSINDAPVTQNVSFTTNEDTPYTESYTAYVSDVDGDNLTIIAVVEPTNGTAACNGTNCTYTPNQNFNGTDSFTYKVNDGQLDSNISTVSVTVNPVDDVPVATNYTVSDGTEDTNYLINVLTTDNSATGTKIAYDPDGDNLTVSIVSQGDMGATVTTDGSIITYSPNANWNGTDQISFKVNDGSNDSNTATISITINNVNDAPVTSNISQTQDENNSKASDLSSFTTDVDGNSLTYTIVSDVTDGTTSLDGSVVTYTPDTNFDGTDSYSYKANDGTVDSNISTVTITVNDVNAAPVATNYTVNDGTEDTNYVVDVVNTNNSASGTKIAYDADGDDLAVSIVSQGANGTATVSGAAYIITYSPNDDWHGTDQITYKVNDGSADSNTATITYNIASVVDRSYLDFDGVNDRVEFDVDWTLFEGYTTNTSGEGAGINSSTLSMWLNLDVQGSQPIYSNVVGNNSVGVGDDQWLSTDGGGTFEFKRNLNNGQTHNLQSTVTANTDEWFHLMVVREKGIGGAEQNGDDLRKGWRIYINGTFRGSLYDSGTRTLTDLGMYLGYADSGFSVDEYLNGSIDSFALWDDFLTPDEVTAVYQLGRNGSYQSNSGNYTSSGDLMLHFDFDEISGTTVVDRVGTSSQNATIVGATIVDE